MKFLFYVINDVYVFKSEKKIRIDLLPLHFHYMISFSVAKYY